jgi:hypothetical protein
VGYLNDIQGFPDPATDRVGVGETLHAKGKTTFLFAVSMD